MTSTAPPASESIERQELLVFAPRQRDRRLGLGDVVMALTRALSDRGDPSLLRGAFEEMLRRVVPVGAVSLRDVRDAGRWPRASAAESITLEIPACPASAPGLLEANFDPGTRPGEWDFQMLGLASHVGALVLEIERGRLALSRAGVGGMGTPVKTEAAARGSSGSAPKMKRDGAAPLIGSTPAMQALRNRIERVAGTDFTVLLEGESGVGKELVARQIHELSRRRNGPFVAINCAALVETLLEAELFGIEDRTATGVRGRRGKFEHADGGTLFLDEVADLAPAAQAKLLRAIQELSGERVGGQTARRVDTRIIVATNRGLRDLVARGHFREDLYYRLSGVELHVPPLRARREDVGLLAAHFLARYRAAQPLGLTNEAVQALCAHDWPGNVRELERTLEGALTAARTETIGLDDLPSGIRQGYAEVVWPSLARGDSMRAWGCRYAHLVLERCRGNKRRACEVLDISYHTLQAYLREAGAEVAASPLGGETVAESDDPVEASVRAADAAAPDGAVPEAGLECPTGANA
jgi:DNA-binding NtrC family response regulator